MDVPLSLEDRIASALRNDDLDADQVAELVSEVQTAIITAGKNAELLRLHAFSPTLSDSQVAKARQQMDTAAFRHERLQTAEQRLQQRIEELRAQAEDRRRLQVYEQVKAERDALAEELAELYPKVVAALSDVVARIALNDQQIDSVNRGSRPSGYPPLASAELVARGFEGFTYNGLNTPRITHDLRLPHWGWALDYAYPPWRR